MSIWKEIRCDHNGNNCLDNSNSGPKGFETGAELRAMARKQGWLILPSDRAVCPPCRKEL